MKAIKGTAKFHEVVGKLGTRTKIQIQILPSMKGHGHFDAPIWFAIVQFV